MTPKSRLFSCFDFTGFVFEDLVSPVCLLTVSRDPTRGDGQV